MKYKAILLDVDGTLIGFESKQASPQVARALCRLQENGVLVVVATGRSHTHVKPGILGGVVPDYVISFNGTCAVDKDGNMLFSHPFTMQQFEEIEELGRQGHPIGYSFEDKYYVYHNGDKMEFLSADLNARRPDLFGDSKGNTRHLESMPFVCFCNYPDELADEFNRTHPTLKMVRHRPGIFDLGPSAHNKATGARELLESLGIGMHETVAIGDGGNDTEMLQEAGLGIAMGNASDAVKAKADYVTDTVQNDGVAVAIRKFF